MLATRLAGRCIHRFPELRPGAGFGDRDPHRSGRWQGDVVSPLKHMLDVVDLKHRRPPKQRGLDLRSIMQIMAQPMA
jgi:hypothetical protein